MNYYTTLRGNLEFSDIHLIDNGSTADNIKLLQKNTIADFGIELNYPHIPRQGILGYPYLWRAIENLQPLFNSVDKIVIIDSDLFLLSQRAIDYVNNFKSGWGTLWCPLCNFPEAALQIITKDCKEYKEFVKTPYMMYNGRTMETVIPWTEVNKDLVGDRYTERGIIEQTPEMDFFAQTLVGTSVVFGMKK
jgi:hypothetical protein